MERKNVAGQMVLFMLCAIAFSNRFLRHPEASQSSEKLNCSSLWPQLPAAGAIRKGWIVFLIIPSLYFLVLYPPLWKDIDAVLQLTSKASAVNVLQYPPVYCFLSRLPFNLASVMEGHSFHHNLLSKQTPSDLGAYLLIILQHAALICSLVYACKAIAGSNTVGLFICASILASMGGLYAQAQTCGSESWSTIATIAIFAAGIDLIKCSKLSAWIIYGSVFSLPLVAEGRPFE